MDAYLDGELPGPQARQLQAHLDHCPACRALIDERARLAALLRAAPAAQPRKSAARFVDEVRMQMRPRVAQAALPAPAALRLAWVGVPVMLALAWVFVQSTLWVGALVGLIPGAGQALLGGASASARLPLDLPPAAGRLLGFALPLELFNWSFLTALVLLLIIGLLYIGWLAGWWARARRQNTSMD